MASPSVAPASVRSDSRRVRSSPASTLTGTIAGGGPARSPMGGTICSSNTARPRGRRSGWVQARAVGHRGVGFALLARAVQERYEILARVDRDLLAAPVDHLHRDAAVVVRTGVRRPDARIADAVPFLFGILEC